MAEPRPFAEVKLVCGIIFPDDKARREAEMRLESLCGPADLRSPDIPFDLTGYYEPQMGRGLRRTFLSFVRLIRPEDLAGIKLATNAVEAEMSRTSGQGRRIVNLDPGYVTPAALIMATAKDFAHRIPLERGIYAHLEFLFSKTGPRALDWTYPDFRRGGYHEFFNEVRAALLKQRKGAGPGPEPINPRDRRPKSS